LRVPPFIARQEVPKFFPGMISPKTLAKLASQGEGPPFYMIRGKVVYDTRELWDWLTRKSIRVEFPES